MTVKNILTRHSGLVKVIAFTITLTALVLIGSAIYYRQLNNLEDARLAATTDFHKEYALSVEKKEYGTALTILDNWEALYKSVPGYDDSYEIGVLYNNRCSLYLIQFETDVLTSTSEGFTPPYHYLDEAEKYILTSISLYEAWIEKYGSLSEPALSELVAQNFPENDPIFKNKNIKKIRIKRVADLKLAQIETSRRLSVSLTNSGVIKRYRNDLVTAKTLYERAISLWDKNYTAQDNLDVLLGRKPQKRSMINKLFPPEKEK